MVIDVSHVNNIKQCQERVLCMGIKEPGGYSESDNKHEPFYGVFNCSTLKFEYGGCGYEYSLINHSYGGRH